MKSPHAIPRGWIPPEPYRLRSIFDKELPGGKITLLEHPGKAQGVPVEFVEGIPLDDNWRLWLSQRADEEEPTLPGLDQLN